MKKNLQLALALMLGLATTVSAQDWSVDSRSRVDMSGDFDKFETEQRVRVGTSFGGDDWAIVLSSDVNYDLDNSNSAVHATLHEAYATANMFDFVDLTVGRQALEFGDGSIIGANDWAKRANTRDAMTFGFDMDFADISAFYSSRTNDFEEGAADYASGTSMGIYAEGEMSGVNFNFMYVDQEGTAGNVTAQSSVTGIGLAYETMGANFNLTYNMFDSETSGDDATMMVVGVNYPMGDFTLMGSMTQMGEDSYGFYGSNIGVNDAENNSWFTHGNAGYFDANDQAMMFGGSYNMGDVTFGAAMTTVDNEDHPDWERNILEVNVDYSLGSNSSLGLKYATDDNRMNAGVEETYMWLTLNVGL